VDGQQLPQVREDRQILERSVARRSIAPRR
jgi:hypothetical protein